MRSTVKALAAIASTLALVGCTGVGSDGGAGSGLPAARSISNGPASDYPVVVGAPYEVDGVTYTPLDTMNFDEVGFADADTGSGITAAHHTLPLPSYIEVTALDTGVTALVRVERRGPMDGTAAVALSAAARSQLGIADGAPVRVRRVNPPEDDRAELRAGRPATLRMTTPQGLLSVLRRRLPAAGAASLADPRQAVVSGRIPNPSDLAGLAPAAKEIPPAPPPTPTPTLATKSHTPAVPTPANARILIQVGAFSIAANAQKLASRIGGQVVRSGSLSLVQAGPFSDRGQAELALAKLRAQGYSDARIRTTN